MDHFNELALEWERPDRVARAHRLVEEVRVSWGECPPRRLLDFGAGTGLMSLPFIDDLDVLVAYDPAEGMREALAEKTASLPEEHADKVVIVGSTEELPAEPLFDGVIVSLVLHHVEDAPAQVGELATHLLSGGSLAVIDFVEGDGFTHPGSGADVHHHGFDPAHMAQWMNDAGLSHVTTRTVYEAIHTNDDGEERPYRLFLALGRR